MRLLCTLLALFVAGCAGYHLGPVKPYYMQDIHRLHVPVFLNKSLEPRIETLMTNIVIKQIQQDGTYEISSYDRADAVMKGTIKEIKRRPLRSVRGNVLASSEFELFISLHYEVIKKGSQLKLDSGKVRGTSDFFVGSDIQQEEREAIPIATESLAKELVSRLSEGW